MPASLANIKQAKEEVSRWPAWKVNNTRLAFSEMQDKYEREKCKEKKK